MPYKQTLEIQSIEIGETSEGRKFRRIIGNLTSYHRMNNRTIILPVGFRMFYLWNDLSSDHELQSLQIGDVIEGENTKISDIVIDGYFIRDFLSPGADYLWKVNRNNHITYSEKLKDPLWLSKREWIVRLDFFHCCKCKKSTSDAIFFAQNLITNGQKKISLSNISILLERKEELNVHHTYYIQGKEPWEYRDEALITLCRSCHKEEHETKNIPIYNNENTIIDYCQICNRCNGEGYIPKYLHYMEGICFNCWGEGVEIENL